MRAQSAHGEGAVRMHAATGSAAATHSKPGGSRSARARVFFFKTKRKYRSTLRDGRELVGRYDFDTPAGLVARGSNLPTRQQQYPVAGLLASCLLDCISCCRLAS
jgi:hypothetical protein